MDAARRTALSRAVSMAYSVVASVSHSDERTRAGGARDGRVHPTWTIPRAEHRADTGGPGRPGPPRTPPPRESAGECDANCPTARGHAGPDEGAPPVAPRRGLSDGVRVRAGGRELLRPATLRRPAARPARLDGQRCVRRRAARAARRTRPEPDRHGRRRSPGRPDAGLGLLRLCPDVPRPAVGAALHARTGPRSGARAASAEAGVHGSPGPARAPLPRPARRDRGSTG